MADIPILIVDDNEANLKVARVALQGEGFDVQTATDGEQALAMLKTFRPRLILMDIQLPGLDGLEITRRLKADPKTRDIVVIAVTAYAMKGDRDKALRAGCDGYIAKPLDPIQLPDEIVKYLGTPPGSPDADAVPDVPDVPDVADVADVADEPDALPVPTAALGTILLVKDNATTRKLYRIALEAEGYSVVEAEDASTALELATNRTPDLILEGLILPDLALAGRLREIVGEQTPIICLSGFLAATEEVRAAGCYDDLLVKPVDPLHLVEAVKGHLLTRTSHRGTAGVGRRVVLVDDDPMLRKLMELWLTHAGFEVQAFETGPHALEAARQAPPDAIVSDVFMPEMDGFSLCIAARSMAELRSTPIVLMSAIHGKEEDRTLAQRVGASDLVARGDSPDGVVEAVLSALASPVPGPLVEPAEVQPDRELRRTLVLLERQIRRNSQLLQRSRLHEALLSVLGAVLEMHARDTVLDTVLGDLLSACLDMSGISRGALYLPGRGSALRLEHQEGFSETEQVRLRLLFGLAGALTTIAAGASPVLVPSPEFPADDARTMRADTGATTLLLVPLRALGAAPGLLILAGSSTMIGSKEAHAFASILGAQFGQAIGLARSFANLAASETNLRRATTLESENERVLEASRLKSRFLANMSHELRTPLNSIIGFAELLYDGEVGPVAEQQKEFLGDILSSGKHLLQLINDVLDLAKVEAGKLVFQPEHIEVDRLIAEVMSTMRSTVATKQLALDVSVDPEIGEFVVDPSRLKQVVYNFVSNAIKFTPEGGRIWLRVLPDGPDFVRLEVEDTGVGIAAADIPRLFVEFQQLDLSASKDHGGTGLGLALSKRLVEAQGGSVGVESSPGEGSVFHARLPRLGRPPHVAVAPNGSASPEAASTVPTILVVEDDPADQIVIQRALNDGGFAVELARTGAEAIAKFQIRAYAAVTLDLLLPDMTGLDVLQAIRANGEDTVPVIVITELTPDAAGGLPVHDVLPKPMNESLLLTSLSRAGVKPFAEATVMVVDDDPMSLKLMATLLESMGLLTARFDDSQRALRALELTRPSAIVLDLLMPDPDGLQFIARLRDTPETATIPVLVWTMKELSRTEIDELHASAAAVLKKSAEPVELAQALRNALSPRAEAGSHV